MRIGRSVRLPAFRGLPLPAADNGVTEGPSWNPIEGRHAVNIANPSFIPVLPETPNGTGVILAPGGSWKALTIDNECIWVAQKLAAIGVSSFVLRYRTIPVDNQVVPLEPSLRAASYAELARAWRPVVGDDGASAVTYLRRHADQFGLNRNAIGLMGFSAGGHLALATAVDHPEARPDFLATIYPVAWPNFEVPKDPPPLFAAFASDDSLGELVVGSTLDVYRSWIEAGGTAELHAYATGGHGFGQRPVGAESDRWLDDFATWLHNRGLLGCA